ncbi:hypothetical protein PVE_R1G1194 [Pseudomonas veronii 1YdBTEX2]|uniref:Uncharacterized protein n=1 Tax=Pseudomonas veronii 1YdBTEX2 TaxID=1295141 RepID=A0A1D3JSZ1_PSEVE|nr:hypothetical protein PVE_R1G1194 [Pseudomonas veronii 1YdBTEX2]
MPLRDFATIARFFWRWPMLPRAAIETFSNTQPLQSLTNTANLRPLDVRRKTTAARASHY